MKPNVAALAATVLAASVAGVLALAPSGKSVRSTPMEATQPSVNPVPVVTAGKSTLETHQAPVPFQLKAHTTLDAPAGAGAAQPPSDQHASEQPPSDQAASEAPDAPKANDSEGGAAAKAAVEADGYKSVKVLRKGDNGVWYAEGLRGSTKVRLIVDAQGTVTSE
jgi:hypothetical protein